MEHATEPMQDLNLRLGVQLFNIILLFLSFLKRIRLEGWFCYIITKFKSQALRIIKIKYWKVGGSGNSPSLIPALWHFTSWTSNPRQTFLAQVYIYPRISKNLWRLILKFWLFWYREIKKLRFIIDQSKSLNTQNDILKWSLACS